MMISPERSYLRSFTKTILFPMIISILQIHLGDADGALAQGNYPNITELNCPKPMIWYTDSNITSNMYCIEQCCLPCPYLNNFYPDGALDRVYRTFSVFGIISFVLMFILALWFLILPSQRNNKTTKLILLPFAISVCCFEFPEFFTLNQQESQCINPVERATIHNNRHCATQAFFTLGGAYAVASWAALLMFHLHMLSIWRSEFIIRKIFYFNIYIWGTSLLAAIIPMATGKVEANNFCFISRDYASIYYYFLCFIYVAFLAHLATFAYMAKVTIKASLMVTPGPMVNKRISIVEAQRAFSHVKTVIVLQWRSLLGAFLMLLVYVINWSYFIIVSAAKIDPPLFLKWIDCLLNGGSQTSCSPKIAPSLSWTIALLFFNRILGILIFIILAAKKSILVEVWDLLNGRINVLLSISFPARHPSPDSRMVSLEEGEGLGRANSVGASVESSSSIRDNRESSSTLSSSVSSPEFSPSAMIKPIKPIVSPPSTPRASFGALPSASRSSLDARHPRASFGVLPSSSRSSLDAHPRASSRSSLDAHPRASSRSSLDARHPKASFGVLPSASRSSLDARHPRKLTTPARASSLDTRHPKKLTTPARASSFGVLPSTSKYSPDTRRPKKITTPASAPSFGVLPSASKSSTKARRPKKVTTPARASFGVLPSASKSSIDPLHPRKPSISFSDGTSGSSRRMSSGSSRSSNTVSSGGMMRKVNRSYEQRKRHSRELAKKIGRNSITEITEDDGVLEMSDDDEAKRTTFGNKESEKWIQIADIPRSSSEL